MLGHTHSSGCFSCRGFEPSAKRLQDPRPLQQGAGPQGLGARRFQRVDAYLLEEEHPLCQTYLRDTLMGETRVKEKKCILLLVVVGRSWSKIL